VLGGFHQDARLSFSIFRGRRLRALTQARAAHPGWRRRQRRTPGWPWVLHRTGARNRRRKIATRAGHVPRRGSAGGHGGRRRASNPGLVEKKLPRLRLQDEGISRSWSMKPRVVLTVAFKLAPPRCRWCSLVTTGEAQATWQHPELDAVLDVDGSNHRVHGTVMCSSIWPFLRAPHFDRLRGHLASRRVSVAREAARGC